MIKSYSPYSYLVFIGVLLLLGNTSYAWGKKDKDEVTARNAGLVLLNSFSCDGVGNNSKEVLKSIANLKGAVASIENSVQECKSLASQVATLPDITAMLQTFKNDTLAEALRVQEGALNEALADLAIVQKLSPGSPEAVMYPTVDQLQLTISNGRAQIYTLRSQYGVDKALASHQKYISGIQQLNDMGTQLAMALRSNQACFQKAPYLKEHVTAGLLGISGFFLSTPMGIATTLAGKLLQNLFNINEGSQYQQSEQNFEPTDQATLIAGMSCALENLGKQHCRILRESKLFDRSTEASDCDKCNAAQKELYIMSDKQKEMLQYLSDIQNWVSRGQIASANPSIQKNRETMKSTYQNYATSLRQSLYSIRDTVSNSPPISRPQILRDGLYKALKEFSILKDPLASQARGDQDPYQSNSPPQNVDPTSVSRLFSEKEQREGFLYFLYDSPDDITKAYSDLQKEYTDSFISNVKSTYESRPPNSAVGMYAKLKGMPAENRPPRTAEIIAMLQKSETVDQILVRQKKFDAVIAPFSQTQITSDKLTNLINDFYGDPLQATSPYQELKRIQTGLHSIPPDFRARFGRLVGLSNNENDTESFDKRIDSVVKQAEDLEKANFNDQKKMNELINDTTKLVGENNELYTQMSAIYTRLQSYYFEKVKNFSAGKDNSTLIDSLFLLNKDILQDSIGFTSNPSLKSKDYQTSQSLSAAQIDSYGNYFEKYLTPAFNYLRGYDVSGREALSAGLQQNISGSLKDNFCIQLLVLTNLGDDIKNFCKDTSVKAGKVTLKFNDYQDADHKDRACAYQNFLHKEAVQRDRRGVVR